MDTPAAERAGAEHVPESNRPSSSDPAPGDTPIAGARTGRVPFHGILFSEPGSTSTATEQAAPEHFADLNLDQIVEAICTGREEYDLKSYFYTPLDSEDAVRFRQEVFQDLEREPIYACISAFAQQMRTVRNYLGQAAKRYYQLQQQGWFLDSAQTYCDAIARLARDLPGLDIQSRGLQAFRDYVAEYARSAGFNSIRTEATAVRQGLDDVAYCVDIKGSRVTVTKFEHAADYSAEVLSTFQKFKQGEAKERLASFADMPDMNHVEARVLDLVAQLFPDSFSALGGYCARHRDYVDRTITAFDRDVQLYLGYLEHIGTMRRAGLTFCYPNVSRQTKEVHCCRTFDLALADKLVADGTTVVLNDFSLRDPERIFVVSGPNQGGKTTFARTFGQLHHLASLGCPVPGTDAQLYLCDRLFTHFEREEDIKNLSGKLQDDLVRIQTILDQATAQSIIILNEIFTSTTLDDAALLGRAVLNHIVARELLCVCVTFVDELSSLGETTVSMVSTVDPDDAAVRTYEVLRRPADGLAYAAAIAKKYGLTYELLTRRVSS